MWFSGLLIVVWDFIVLPFRFIRETFVWLGKIGEEGSVSAGGDPELPFLNWIVIAGRVLVTFFAIVGVSLAIIGGIVSMNDDAAAGLVLLILGPIITWGLVWLLGMWLESIHLLARIAGRLHSVWSEVHNLRTDLRQPTASPSTGGAAPPPPQSSPPTGPPGTSA